MVNIISIWIGDGFVRFPNKWYQSWLDVRIMVEEAPHLSSIGKIGKKEKERPVPHRLDNPIEVKIYEGIFLVQTISLQI